MFELLILFIKPFLLELIAGLGVAFTVFFALMKGRSEGRAQERQRQLEASIRNEQDRKALEDQHGRLGDDELNRLQDPWTRK